MNKINPIIWADIPDPDVIRVGNAYYMTSTTMYFTPGCPIMRSYDLVNWEIVNYVYDILEDGDKTALRGNNAYGKGSWASCLRYHNGMFYILFMAYDTGKTYIYKTDDIENGRFNRTVLNACYHDMSVLFDDDGCVYMVYGNGTINIIELMPDLSGIKQDGMDKILLQNVRLSDKGLSGEGAHIYKIDGKYYIFFITWPAGGVRTELCYRSDRIDGEYESKIVLQDEMGTAQGGIVDTPDGKWYAMLFRDSGAVGRIPVLVPVTWENGWPMMGTKNDLPVNKNLPFLISDEFEPRLKKGSFHSNPEDIIYTGSSENPEENLYKDDAYLSLEWQWNHNPNHTAWSLTERNSFLRLTNKHIAATLLEARNTITQRTVGPACSGNVALEITGMKNGDIAGLAALQHKYGYVGAIKENDKNYIVMYNREEIERVEINNDRVYLRIDFDFNAGQDKAYFYYSLDEKSWAKIGNTLDMQYLLEHFTGYRFALFSYATKEIGGYADFDYFRVLEK